MPTLPSKFDYDGTDPIFSAIKRHLAADGALAIAAENEDQDAARFKVASTESCNAYARVMSVKPTTFQGLLALARHLDDYLSEGHGTERHSNGYSNGEIGDDALRALIVACHHLGEAQQP